GAWESAGRSDVIGEAGEAELPVIINELRRPAARPRMHAGCAQSCRFRQEKFVRLKTRRIRQRKRTQGKILRAYLENGRACFRNEPRSDQICPKW
ncbi:hypothetical protein, partial [Burkholderia paludis]|uniref:hypothetical protein n=1 Tax=Burkholderia paludis TaxID=1506587 RepID=UPI001F193B3A